MACQSGGVEPVDADTPDPLERLELPLRLATTLNQMEAGLITAPEAEHLLRADGRPHHVSDETGLLKLDGDGAIGLRLVLARVARLRGPWALVVPAEGDLGGLRGPIGTNRRALEHGAIVVHHEGGIGWVCDEVGHGVQWTLLACERPLLPDDPGQATRALAAAVAEATGALAGATVAAQQPRHSAPNLGRGYPPASQTLLERAWLVARASAAGLDASASATMSHQVLTRERVLRPLGRAARRAISSAVSWPSRALVE